MKFCYFWLSRQLVCILPHKSASKSETTS